MNEKKWKKIVGKSWQTKQKLISKNNRIKNTADKNDIKLTTNKTFHKTIKYNKCL